jgi:cobalamin-dependent methionine synthase I
MDDRKTRIAKLSERFKPDAGRSKRSAKQRERRSYYLDTEITERLDRGYKEFSHQLYPQAVRKSVFIETIIEYGLDNLSAVGEIIKAKSEMGSAD